MIAVFEVQEEEAYRRVTPGKIVPFVCGFGA